MSADRFHPELRLARFVPRSPITQRTMPTIQRLTCLAGRRPPIGGKIERCSATSSVRVFRPTDPTLPSTGRPALLWMHGGGLIIGSASMADSVLRHIARRHGAVCASVEYRLAPQHPFPAPVEDCWDALVWLSRQPDVDPNRIAIGGESAGGGLAAALAILARERGEVQPCFQVLSYPMLDDRSSDRDDIDPSTLRLWGTTSNRLGWDSYLGGRRPEELSACAVPGRCEDLTGLPSAWVGVGTNDLFHDEDLDYACRLREAGSDVELMVVEGAYHGFDLERWAPVAKAYRRAQIDALVTAWNR